MEEEQKYFSNWQPSCMTAGRLLFSCLYLAYSFPSAKIGVIDLSGGNMFWFFKTDFFTIIAAVASVYMIFLYYRDKRDFCKVILEINRPATVQIDNDRNQKRPVRFIVNVFNDGEKSLFINKVFIECKNTGKKIACNYATHPINKHPFQRTGWFNQSNVIKLEPAAQAFFYYFPNEVFAVLDMNSDDRFKLFATVVFVNGGQAHSKYLTTSKQLLLLQEEELS